MPKRKQKVKGKKGKKLTSEKLSAMSLEELGEAYRNGRVPRAEALDGDYLGKVFAISDEPTIAFLFAPVKKLADTPFFPWRGKSFCVIGNDVSGINRLFSDVLPLRVFRFETRVEKSLFDDSDTLVLNYDLPGNPTAIKKVRDELREVGDNLLLGPMYFQTTLLGPKLVLYFGLEK
jgi:hypothetical protein